MSFTESDKLYAWIGFKTLLYNNKEIFFTKGSTLPINGKNVEFIGELKNKEDFVNLPPYDCIYLFAGMFYYREVKLVEMYGEKIKNLDKDEEDFMYFPINPKVDSELLIIVKYIINTNKITKTKFRELFQSDSDMNNFKKQLESKDGKLTKNRFDYIIQRLGFRWAITIYDKMDKEIFIDLENSEMPQNISVDEKQIIIHNE